MWRPQLSTVWLTTGVVKSESGGGSGSAPIDDQNNEVEARTRFELVYTDLQSAA